MTIWFTSYVQIKNWLDIVTPLSENKEAVYRKIRIIDICDEFHNWNSIPFEMCTSVSTVTHALKI